ncbi:EAL domain-containing protein [Bradyrhizobium sp. SHOUNA76]|uniref:bifunctional diguanylate cyclase/phosphodiesterase n=1 Tax=Bradyrhizobium sp. SHOUNA76 TaxID=2908927 RepID=UPI001FF3BC05|nr:EAL domain-containing protein [Bradyrhizobium sp. SHOUNA76]MCJ9700159.1 EAL domain-containing protein [Bradyrhizobium sp. SHOUNA76]
MGLVAVVLATGVLGLGLIGGSTALRLQQQLRHQAAALGELSEDQLAHRLDGEAQLARARIEALGAETASRLRQIAQRADVAKAVASNNDVTIRELLSIVASTSGFERLIAFDGTGRVIGANTSLDLLALNQAFEGTALSVNLNPILKDNSRSHPQGEEGTYELKLRELSALGLPQRQTIAHTAIEPVFDDFGDLVGALAAIRPLGRTERTLENFTSLANAGVVIITGDNEIVSSAGPEGVRFSGARTLAGLQRSDDGNYVARCVDYEATLKVCTFASASLVTTTRDQMFQIGASHTRSLMWQFLASAALALGALVVALLAAVRHLTKGLSALARTAQEIAGGNLDVQFRATGSGEVRGLALAFEQMLTHLRASTRRIRQLAFYDTVSRIPNREKMRIDAPALIDAEEGAALFFLDLDGFKSINDTFGHKAGDELLRMVAERLNNLLTSKGAAGKCLLARVGGDEFVAIIAGVKTVEAASFSAREMIETLQVSFKLQSNHATIGVSIGIAICPTHGTTYDDLLIRADLAMYVAKSSGRNTYAFFTPDLAEIARARHALETDLALAIRDEELVVHYQPKVSCRDGRILGVEALARWHHPKEGDIPPARFIKIAEEIGLIMEIDRFVLRRALAEIGGLIRAGSNLVLAVNVAATEIEDPLFIRDMITAVREADFPPPKLEIEITESVAMRNPDVVRERISLLRQMGIRFAMDDFGAGYSNLSTMARLPFDAVKLDRTLVAGVAEDREKQTILRLALGLADELGFETVVEGVETAEDLRFAAENGATMAQGYLFSPPVSLEEFAVLLQPLRLASGVEVVPRRDAAERKTMIR